MAADSDGWRFHAGTPDTADRRRLMRFMRRRSWWALRRYWWSGTLGKLLVLGAVTGLMVPVHWSWATSVPGAAAVASALRGAVVTTVVLYVPADVWGQVERRRRMTRPGPWVTHWCEGPKGELAVRLTRPTAATGQAVAQWRGVDLYSIGGAAAELLQWLAGQAHQAGAVLVVCTRQPWLEDYYQNKAGLVLIEQPRLRTRRVQLGKSVLCSDPAALPVRPWWRRPLTRDLR